MTKICSCCGQELPKTPKDVLDRAFEVFWSMYPKKTAKAYCREIWRRKQLSEEIIIPALKRAIWSMEWQKDGGKFIPNPSTWLNQGRWEDEGFDPSALRLKPERPVFPAKVTSSVDHQHYTAWKKAEGYPPQFLESRFEDDIEPVKKKYLQSLKNEP